MSTNLPWYERSFSDASFQVVSGFDGYLDRIVRVRPYGGDFFRKKDDFGSYIVSKSGTNCSVELRRQIEKIGGNMPIFSHALSSLGQHVDCLGAMGYPDISPLFSKLTDGCTLYSFADPGVCDAIEFSDGKLMLASCDDINEINYDLLKKRVGEETLFELCSRSDLIAMLNWSELPGVRTIWKGLADHIFEKLEQKKRYLLIDLSDCSGRSDEDIIEAIQQINEFSSRFSVLFSVNLNELQVLCQRLGIDGTDPEELTGKLREKTGVELLVTHFKQGAIGADPEGLFFIPTEVNDSPVILTGGGDHFNAGLAFALLNGLSHPEALDLANHVSGYYITNGISPSLEELIAFKKEKLPYSKVRKGNK